eukprot:COSAG01_NODE_1826_length_9132_cov_12.328684_2_plen_431_part_00
MHSRLAMGHMEVRNRDEKTGRGHEKHFVLTHSTSSDKSLRPAHFLNLSCQHENQNFSRVSKSDQAPSLRPGRPTAAGTRAPRACPVCACDRRGAAAAAHNSAASRSPVMWALTQQPCTLRLLPLVLILSGGPQPARAYTPRLNEMLGPDITCMVHRLAFDKAVELLPHMLPPNSLRRRQVWDSLVTGEMTEGVGDCNGTTAAPPPDAAGSTRPVPPTFATGAVADSIFVDYASGEDTNPGTQDSPVKTVGRGVQLARVLLKRGGGGRPRAYLLLREGIHHLARPLALGPADSGLTVQNFEGEEVWLSGAVPVNPRSWETHGSHGAWKTKLPTPTSSRRTDGSSSGSGSGSGAVWGLHELHDPADLSLWQVVKTLARYPNAGARNARESHWAQIGPNATWLSRQPVFDRGHQIVVNATTAVPKTVTNFPDY